MVYRLIIYTGSDDVKTASRNKLQLHFVVMSLGGSVTLIEHTKEHTTEHTTEHTKELSIPVTTAVMEGN